MWCLDERFDVDLITQFKIYCLSKSDTFEYYLIKNIIKDEYFTTEEFTRIQFLGGINHQIQFSKNIQDTTGLLGLSFDVVDNEVYYPFILCNSDIYEHCVSLNKKNFYSFRFLVVEPGLLVDISASLNDILKMSYQHLIDVDSSHVFIDVLKNMNLNHEVSSPFIYSLVDLLPHKYKGKKFDSLSIHHYRYFLDRLYDADFLNKYMDTLSKYYNQFNLVVDNSFVSDFLKYSDALYYNYLFDVLSSLHIKFKFDTDVKWYNKFLLKLFHSKHLDYFVECC